MGANSMLHPPFTILSCSWPRPVEHTQNNWTSEPEWDAPLMPTLPQIHWDVLNDELCWTVNWRRLFKQGVVTWNPQMGGEMRGFHVVFCIAVKESGTLVFWDDDGSIIRRNGEVIYCDRTAHALRRSEIHVQSGDILEVAQWQLGWSWLWGAYLLQEGESSAPSIEDILKPYLRLVQQRLTQPDGPPLKMYVGDGTPLRTIISLYSMIANGYVPSAVYLFGENQWSERTRQLFTTLLPFAEIVTTSEVIARMQTMGGLRLAEMASRYWFVMKACVSLFYSPQECCVMDDDVFILERLDDALAAFQEHDLVYTPDQDLG